MLSRRTLKRVVGQSLLLGVMALICSSFRQVQACQLGVDCQPTAGTCPECSIDALLFPSAATEQGTEAPGRDVMTIWVYNPLMYGQTGRSVDQSYFWMLMYIKDDALYPDRATRSICLKYYVDPNDPAPSLVGAVYASDSNAVKLTVHDGAPPWIDGHIYAREKKFYFCQSFVPEHAGVGIWNDEGKQIYNWDDDGTILIGNEGFGRNEVSASDQAEGNGKVGWVLEVDGSPGNTYWRYALTGSGFLARKRVTFVHGDSVESAIYVFYPDDPANPPDPKANQLWFVLGPDDVRRYLQAARTGGGTNLVDGVDLNDPGALCGLDGISAETLASYANITYDAYTDFGGVKKPTRIHGPGCPACGGGSESGQYDYGFGWASGGSGSSGWSSYRRTTMPSEKVRTDLMAADGRVIINVEQAPDSPALVTHTLYNAMGHVTEVRHPSACAGYSLIVTGGQVTNVSPATPGTTGDHGLVELTEYDTHGNMTARKVKEGINGTVHWRQKFEYGTAGQTAYRGETIYRVTAQTDYPDEPTDATVDTDPQARRTTYTYYFYKDGETNTDTPEFITITHPSVPTDQNGTGNTTSVTYHYYQSSNLYYADWIKHEDGSLSFTHETAGSGYTDLSVTDARTDSTTGYLFGTSYQPPLEPSGTVHPRWTSETGTHSATAYAYDSQGRNTSTTQYLAPPVGGGSSLIEMGKQAYAYLVKNETQTVEGTTYTTSVKHITLSTSLIDANGHYDYVPMQIEVGDLQGRTLMSAQGLPSDGADGDLADDWTVSTDTFIGTLLTKTEMAYDSSGRLSSTTDWSDGSDTNKDKYVTAYTYDGTFAHPAGRQVAITAPDGTITWTVYDLLGRPSETWVGTNAAGALETDPSNGGNNNMKRVSKVFYDYADDNTPLKAGDGLVTQTRSYYDDTHYYASDSLYDGRGRLTDSRGPDNIATHYLQKVVVDEVEYPGQTTQTYYDPDEDFEIDSELIAQNESYADTRGRIYKTIVYDVDSSGEVDEDTTHRMTSKTWYDLTGRTIKTENPNGLFQKTKYDTLGRATASYVCYDSDDTEGGSAYSGAGTVTGDTVIEQNQTFYNARGLAVASAHFQRNDGDTSTGVLTTSHAFISVSAAWYDDLGRPTTRALYGNTPSALTDSNSNGIPDVVEGTAPAPNSSNDIIVSVTHYDYGRDVNAQQQSDDQHHWGEVDQITDNANHVTRTEWGWDGTHPLVRNLENYTSGTPGSDQNRITERISDAKGRLWKLVAKNGSSGDQVTAYIYGTSVTDSSPLIYRNDVLAAVIYPDSDDTFTSGALGNGTDGTFDRVEYKYDRMGRPVLATDQRQVVHAFEYVPAGNPGAGQMFADKVTNSSMPTGVDGTIRRIDKEFDERGRVTKVTSYSDEDGGIGYIVNQVKFTFSATAGGWGALTKIEQANAGAVTTGTPAIDYTYADGAVSAAAKYLRLTSVTYPGPATRRPVHYNYPATGIGDMLSRLDNMDDGVAAPNTVTYARYSYLGAATIVKVEHPATSEGADAGLTLSYDPDDNHSYSAWDRFGRVLDQTWKPVSGQAYDRHLYTYDRSGNRLTRQTEGQGLLSQEYSYDGLNRLTEFHRGQKDGNGQIPVTTDPENEIFRTDGQTWTLDQLGNWPTFQMDANGDGVYTAASDLNQSRTHNLVNEIDNDNDHTNTPSTNTLGQTSGQAVWLEPQYDAAGNMIEGPSGLDPTVRIKLIYDAWNRLVKVTDSSETPVTIAVYRYDGQNHRIRKLTGGPSTWTVTEYYYNAAWQVLEERKSSAVSWNESTGGAGPSAVTDLGPQYLWDIRYIDAPVCRFVDIGGGEIETVFFCTDANMNVTALVGAYLQPGAQGPHYEYDPYGKVHVYNLAFEYQGNDPGTTEILYCGYRYDPETGMYHVRNRMYQPMLGRWMQRDRCGYINGLNAVGYVYGRPNTFMDPFGTWAMVGTPRLYNSGTIASLDALISGGTPFADIARNWETDINNEYGDDFKGVQIDRKASLGSAGVFEIANPSYFAGMARVHARTYALAGRLFYIVVPICSKGLKDAYISIDEKWKQEVFDGHKWTDISPVDHGTYTHGMNLVWALRLGDFMRVGTLRQPIEENGVTYDKVIILGDAPHVSSTLDAVPMLQIDKFIQKLTVNATLSVKSNYADMGGRITKVDVLRAKYKFVVGHNENGGLIDQKVQWQ